MTPMPECRWCADSNPPCHYVFDGGYCTRRDDHEGPHVACGADPAHHAVASAPVICDDPEALSRAASDPDLRVERQCASEWLPSSLRSAPAFGGRVATYRYRIALSGGIR